MKNTCAFLLIGLLIVSALPLNGAAEVAPVNSNTNSTIPASNGTKFVNAQEAANRVNKETRAPSAAEADEVQLIFGKKAAKIEIVSLDGGTHYLYYDAQGNLIGKKIQVTGTQQAQPPKWYDKDNTVVSSVKHESVPAAQQTELKKIFGTVPTTSETITLKGATHTFYYDSENRLIGKKVQQTGTQETKPAEYFDKNNNRIETTNNAEIKAPVRPPDNETDPAKWTAYYKAYVAYIDKLTDVKQKKQAWETLSADMLKMCKEHPERVAAGAIGEVMRAMTDELKEKYRNPDYKLDLNAAQTNLVNAALTLVKSDAFGKLDAGQQNHVVGRFTGLAVELSWRSAFNTANKALYSKISEFFKTAMESDSSNVRTFAFNQLMHLYRVDVWNSKEGNKDVANQILKDALKCKGGIEGLIATFLKDTKDGELNADLRAQAAMALGNIIWHHSALSTASGHTITDAEITKVTKEITAFLDGVNKGDIKVSAGSRNGMMHYFGNALNVLMNDGKHTTEASKAFANAFIKMARASYLLGEDKGGNTSLQTSVINVLTHVMNKATSVKYDDLAKQCKETLLDKDFDVDAYIKNTRKKIGETTNADSAAYLCQGLANLAKINLANKTGKIEDQDVLNIVSDIKAWVSDAKNLLNMRNMSWQKQLYEAVAALIKEACKKGSKLGDNEALAKNLEAIFSTLTGLKDSLVAKLGTAKVESLVKALKTAGFKDLAYRLEAAVCPDSAALLKKAWEYYEAKDMAGAKAFADEAIKRYTDEAVKQQASLKDYAPKGKEADYWALNDVATAHFILGKIYKSQKDTAKAKTEFKIIIDKFGFAQCWDTKGWWWKVKEAAEKELKDL